MARSMTTDRKSTRLNSSHLGISYAVFCLKKKKQKQTTIQRTQPMHGARPSTDTHWQSAIARVTSRSSYVRVHMLFCCVVCFFFFFNDPGPPGIFPFSPPRPFPI